MPSAIPITKFRVYAVDGYGLVRRGLSDLIGGQADMEMCGEAEDAGTAFNMIMKVTPDIVTTEISLPGNCGLELIKSIRRLERNIGVLVISMCDEFVYAERALRAGAHGFVNKQTGIASIPDAIRQILTGQFAFTPPVQQRVCENLVRREGRENSSVQGLSDRELEVGNLIGHGATTREIATHLAVSVKTVETHRAHIKLKLGLPNASRLLQFWFSWAASADKQNHQLALPGLNGSGSHVNGTTAAPPAGHSTLHGP